MHRIQDFIMSVEGGVISDHDFMCSMGMTADRLLDHIDISDEEILERFGQTRAEHAESLGLPTEAEVIEFLKRYAKPHAVSD